MWKDWLSFTRKEQYGLVLLITLIAVFLAIRVVFSLVSKPAEINLISEIEFSSEPASKPGVENKNSDNKKERKFSYNFFQFNPNTVSVTELSRMGFSPFVIVNWMKYREAGGLFKNKQDVGKIYGLDSLALKKIPEYIVFNSGGEQHSLQKEVILHKSEDSDGSRPEAKKKYPDSVKQKLRIDINRADTSKLQLIKGIGPVFSQRIVGFRKILGGFYSIDQLGEVYGFPPDLVESVREYLFVNPEDVQKIDVNSLSLRSLKAHPYISFYQAREIVEYRQKNGRVSGRKVLEEFSSFDRKSLEKVIPYLSFEEKYSTK